VWPASTEDAEMAAEAAAEREEGAISQARARVRAQPGWLDRDYDRIYLVGNKPKASAAGKGSELASDPCRRHSQKLV